MRRRPKVWPLRFAALLFAVVFVLSAVMTGTYCWQSEQEATNSNYGRADIVVPVELVKLEKTADGTETTVPIPNTEFYLYKANGTQIGGRYRTDENGKIRVQLPVGEFYFLETSPSLGYTYDTDVNGGSVTKYSFVVTGQEEKVTVTAYNRKLNGNLLIRKTVENSDGSALNPNQQNTAFEFTVVFSDGGTYAYEIDNGAEQMLASGDKLYLRSGQTACFTDIPFGVLYDVVETPFEGYTTVSQGHRGNITGDFPAIADFVNRWDMGKTGSLIVSKEVVGEVVDTEQEFRFVITLGEVTEEFVLKHGETKEFVGIPVGTEYTVAELIDEGAAYIPANESYTGCILSSETLHLPFVNVIYVEPPVIEAGSLTVNKTVSGENTDTLKEFAFAVSFAGEGAPEMVAFTLKAGEEFRIDELPHGISYMVREVDSAGYEPLVESASGYIVGNHTVSIPFVNTVPDIPEETVKLTVKKVLAGELLESDLNREFSMTLTVDGVETQFTLKADEIKEFVIPHGAHYAVREENYIGDGFSQSIVNGTGVATEELTEVVITNAFVGEARLELQGEKTWNLNGHNDVPIPESITLRLKNGDVLVEEITVTPNDDGRWLYSFIVPKYNADGSEAQYTLEEDPVVSFRARIDGFNVTNTYVSPVEVDPPLITKVVSGENAPTGVFEFVFTGQHGTPMPEGSEGYRKNLTLTGAGQLEIGKIKYEKAGTYVYTVHEKNLGSEGWKYDSAVYTVTVVIAEENDTLSATTTITKGGTPCEGLVFTNTFDNEDDETVVVSGVKTWNHGKNPENKRPTYIVVEVYGDGVAVQQKVVRAEDSWQYSFALPRYADDGHEIVYTIDELDVEHYEKDIRGYDITNTYVGNPDTPDNPDVPSPPTGDNFPIDFWFALMILSLIGLIVTTTLGKRQIFTCENR